MSTEGIPRHLGLILDGNRRWATAQGIPKLEGHRKGYENLKDIAQAAHEAGVEYLSAYIFSTENWKRSEEEVGYLMKLVVDVFSKDINTLIEKNIRVIFLGSREGVSKTVLKAINGAEERSKDKTGGTLALCFNYGGHLEIVDAVKKIIASGMDEQDVDVDAVTQNIYYPEIPPVDFMIRTSGEQRLSNFMMWRMAYSELYFTDKHWPAFTIKDLHEALEEYARRQRRYGK